jgi:hypothetical protein
MSSQFTQVVEQLTIRAGAMIWRQRAEAGPLRADALDGKHLARLYGFFLIGGHAVVFSYFLTSTVLFSLVKGVEPFCWSFFENCGQYRLESPGELRIVSLAYLALILLALYTRLYRRSLFTIAIAAVNVFLIGIVSLDYRLRANEFYMLFWLNGVFLVWRHRRWAMPLLLISFYFWAGRLKLNHEWLSGSVLYGDLWFISPQYVPAACTYVVILEMVFIWGLLARHRMGAASYTGPVGPISF